MILKLGRVLERNPVTMEYYEVLHQHKDQQSEAGEASTENPSLVERTGQ